MNAPGLPIDAGIVVLAFCVLAVSIVPLNSSSLVVMNWLGVVVPAELGRFNPKVMLAPANCCSVARTLPLRTPCENVSELLGPSPGELNSTIRHCAPVAVHALYAAPSYA